MGHIDFDYFYAQCEEIRQPELRGKPLAVCVFSGRTEDSGVVSTANYVARKYGVKSGIPIRVAKSRLAMVDNAVFLPIDMPYYSAVSQAAMAIIDQFADVLEQVGVDECYVDISNQVVDFEAARKIAESLKKTVAHSTGLTCSVGIAPNKMLAKVASDVQKPDGLTVIAVADVDGFVSQLAVEKIAGIGPKTAARLSEMGAKTMGEVRRLDMFTLAEEFGKKTAVFLHNAARGIDEEPVAETQEKKQIARIATLKVDATSSEEMLEELRSLCSSVAATAESRKLSYRSVAVLLFLDNLDQKSKSRTLKTHASSSELVYSTARALLEELMESGSAKVRRLGVRLGEFQDSGGQNTMSQFIGD